MNDLTLDSLLRGLEKQASDESASKEDKDEKDSKASRPSDEELAAVVAREKEEHGENLDKKAPEMDKSAAFNMGVALARDLLQKQANVVVGEQQMLAAAQESTFQPNPEGTKEQVAAQIVQRVQATGAVNPDATVPTAPAAPAPEMPAAQAAAPIEAPQAEEGPAPAPKEDDEVEKVAAVQALVAEGVSFDDAVSLVKQAEADLAEEADMQIKMAAMGELMAQGVDFEAAAEMIKQASYEEPNEELIKLAFVAEAMDSGLGFDDAVALLKEASEVADGQQVLAAEQAPIFQPNPQGTKEQVAAQVVQKVQDAGAVNPDDTVAEAPATAGLSAQEKRAFLCSLMDNGLDFESAAKVVSHF